MAAPMHEAHVRNRYEMAIAIAAKLQAEGVAPSDAHCTMVARSAEFLGPSADCMYIVINILRTFQAARDLRAREGR
jgi:hypothetical protein